MLNSQYAGHERLKYVVPSLPFMYKTASYAHNFYGISSN